MTEYIDELEENSVGMLELTQVAALVKQSFSQQKDQGRDNSQKVRKMTFKVRTNSQGKAQPDEEEYCRRDATEY
jgi:hypothetical protein